MDSRRLVKVSKYLSKHLRHQPERLGLALAPGGWVPVDELLAACARHHFPLTREQLVAAIRGDGLRKMARHHVPLSKDVATAKAVGGRHGKAVVFVVDAAAMR